MQEPLYSLSWQATIRSGKRCFTCSAFLKSVNKGEWGATPSLFGSVRVIFLSGYAAPFAFTRNGKGSQILETDQRTLQSKISRQSDSMKIQTPLPVQIEAQIQAV